MRFKLRTHVAYSCLNVRRSSILTRVVRILCFVFYTCSYDFKCLTPGLYFKILANYFLCILRVFV